VILLINLHLEWCLPQCNSYIFYTQAYFYKTLFQFCQHWKVKPFVYPWKYYFHCLVHVCMWYYVPCSVNSRSGDSPWPGCCGWVFAWRQQPAASGLAWLGGIVWWGWRDDVPRRSDVIDVMTGCRGWCALTCWWRKTYLCTPLSLVMSCYLYHVFLMLIRMFRAKQFNVKFHK